MDVQVISLPTREAGQAFRHYRDAVRGDRQKSDASWKKEDVALMRAYKALAKGTRIINLLGVMKLAGIRDDGFPKFAVARADGKKVFCRVWPDGAVRFNIKGEWDTSKPHSVSFPAETLPRWVWSPARRDRAETIVPIVPPQLRPLHRLANYHILWEVEQWLPLPPRDPMLLKHLGGWLYAVLAVWDLTELERAVLGAGSGG